MIFVDSGVEGLEWFVDSDLSRSELHLAGRRGRGRCQFEPSSDPTDRGCIRPLTPSR